MTRRIFILVFGVVLTSLILNSCSKSDDQETPHSRGEIIYTKFISDYSATTLKGLVLAAGIQIDRELEYNVEAIKFSYYTQNVEGTIVEATAAVMFPKNIQDLPLLSLQHGTIASKTKVASVSPVQVAEGFVGLISGSLGFVSCVPDYLGLGDSDMLHPYLHSVSTANACVDLLIAVKHYCQENGISLNGDLYLGGYSQGGHATLALQKELESNYSNNFEIVASAPQAGPYDLKGTIDSTLAFADEYESPALLAYLLTAYNDVYKWNRLDEIFKAPYASQMNSFFDGTNTISEISNALPATVSELLKEEFLNAYIAGTETGFANALEENSLLNWSPNTPIRFYHSFDDEIVPYQNMLTATQILNSNGASSIKNYTVNGLNHGDASLALIPLMLEWFDSLNVAGAN